LLLEAEIPGVPATIHHFYVVSAYAIQHPESMGLSREAIAGLRKSLADALAGRVTVAELRHRAGTFAQGSARVARRPDEPPARWPSRAWPMTVAEVCTTETFGAFDTVEEFGDRVARWARAVVETLDNAGL
jgi:hypothetical protein